MVFHASDILPGYLSDVYGPITTSYKLLAQLDRIQLVGWFSQITALELIFNSGWFSDLREVMARRRHMSQRDWLQPFIVLKICQNLEIRLSTHQNVS